MDLGGSTIQVCNDELPVAEEGGEGAPIIPVVEPRKSKRKTSKPDQRERNCCVTRETEEDPCPKLMKCLEGGGSSSLILQALPKGKGKFQTWFHTFNMNVFNHLLFAFLIYSL